MEFAVWLAAQIKNYRLSLYSISKKSGVHQTTIKNWLNGAKPQESKAGAVRKAVEELISEKEKLVSDLPWEKLAEERNNLVFSLPEEQKKEIASGINAEGEGWTDMQKDAVNFVLSLPPERLEMFIKMGKAAFEEESHD